MNPLYAVALATASLVIPASLALPVQATPPTPYRSAASATPAWTWTLYDGNGALVLAEEIADSPALRTTLECAVGTGAVTLTLYPQGDAAAVAAPVEPVIFARITSDRSEAQSEARFGRQGRLETSIRVEHPAFSALSASGHATVTAATTTVQLSVPQTHIAKLRRFADLCAS